MLVFAMMIGVISDSIGEKVDDLKQGKSKVIETEHTLILGWNEKGLAILRQLGLANASEGGMPVVVLCEQSKQTMEEMLRAAISSKDDGLKLYGTRVIFRSGNPLAEHDLVLIRPDETNSRTFARHGQNAIHFAIICFANFNIHSDDSDSVPGRRAARALTPSYCHFLSL